MNINAIEIEIIKKFVNTNKQERIIGELANPKKRKSVVFMRFPGPDIFKENCLQPVNYMSQDELEKKLFQLGCVQEVYYIGESYIGEMALKDAARRANDGEICIVYCGNGIGYYQGEQEYGSPPRFLLSMNSDCVEK